MSSPLWKCFLAGVALLLVTTVDARAQLCGDGDNSGAVTVTDGVQALRAAAGLASSCTNATCDVDGSGSVTVTDGVNVLRKAAGIVIAENCAGGVNAQIQELLQNTVPIFGGLTKIGTGAAAAGSSDTFPCDNSDGFVTFGADFIQFDNCILDNFGYQGTLSTDQAGSVIGFDISIYNFFTEELFSFEGSLSFRVKNNTDVIDGQLSIQFSSLGNISVQFEDVGLDSEGDFVDGSLFFNADGAGIDGVVGIRIGFTNTAVSPVTVLVSDGPNLEFDYNVVTGVLTPASN